MPNYPLRLALAFITAHTACSASSPASPNSGNVGFGGAQDIGQFRQILAEGGIPAANTLDANGFFSEHHIELPPPRCGDPLCGHAMLSVGPDWITGERQTTLQVSLNTALTTEDITHKPIDFIVVVDTSGSMAVENRLDYVRQGLRKLIDNADALDRIAIVEYNTTSRTVAPLRSMTEKQALHAVVTNLVAGGSTNFYDGLERGLRIATTNADPQRNARVLLLSDGQPTAGITDDTEILRMARTYVAEGVGLTSIGVGTSFNVQLMRGLSEMGAGNFYFLEDARAIDEVFVSELEFSATPIALSLAIEVSLGPDHRAGEVLGTKLWRNTNDGIQVAIPAAFLATRRSDTPDPNGRRGGGSAIMIELNRTQISNSTQRLPIGSVRLRYQLPDGSTVDQQLEVIQPDRLGELDADDIYVSHDAMTKNYAVCNVFRSLRRGAQLADVNHHCALHRLTKLQSQLRVWPFPDPDLTADSELVAQFVENLRTQGARDIDAPSCDYEFEPAYAGEDVALAGCSTNTGSASFGLLLMVCIVVVARRRRLSLRL